MHSKGPVNYPVGIIPLGKEVCAHLIFYTPENNGKNGEFAKFFTLYEYFEAWQKHIYESDNEEIFIRLRILWGFNGRVLSLTGIWAILTYVNHS